MIERLRFAVTAVLAAFAFILVLPFHLIGLAIGGRAAGLVPVAWHRFVTLLLGVRVVVTGQPAGERPLLLLSNHMSWLDITVLGSITPLSFIAKSEVAAWPVFGWLAKLQRSVFIDRQRRHATGATADLVAERLSQGDVIVLFAEGTSSDGNRVLPFRSALVGAAQRTLVNGGSAWVQPVAIAYVRMLGLPMGRQHRPQVAWYGGADLLPHLKRLMGKGAVDVHVVFGPARRLESGADRKKLAEENGALVRRLVAGLNAGHAPEALLKDAMLPPAGTR
ncbi:MAG TPA: lysophospholipid acyltransferase family protein [Afifellaceae bacterium]|nr:lysophospholipid acyltransferase family protein [Afifellaceae bacterium]